MIDLPTGVRPLGFRPRTSSYRGTTVTSLVHAQAEAVALHRPYLYRYALSKLRRAETAEESCRTRSWLPWRGRQHLEGSRRSGPGLSVFSSTRSSIGSDVKRAIRSVEAPRTTST